MSRNQKAFEAKHIRQKKAIWYETEEKLFYASKEVRNDLNESTPQ